MMDFLSYSNPQNYKNTQKNSGEVEKQFMTRVFSRSDEKNKGYLSRSEVKIAFVELFGYKPSKYEVTQVMQAHGSQFDAELGLTLNEFLEAAGEKMAKKDLDEEIRQTFLAFDVHCRGFLTAEDVRKVFAQVASHIPPHTVDTNFRELDRDGDGRIGYKDFEFMMKYNVSDHI